MLIFLNLKHHPNAGHTGPSDTHRARVTCDRRRAELHSVRSKVTVKLFWSLSPNKQHLVYGHIDQRNKV